MSLTFLASVQWSYIHNPYKLLSKVFMISWTFSNKNAYITCVDNYTIVVYIASYVGLMETTHV